MHLVKIKVYQVKNIEKCNYSFSPWRLAEKEFTMKDYKKVYEGTQLVDDSQNEDDTNLFICENLFTEFNITNADYRKEKNFKGHSISVSDLIEIYNPITNSPKYYYCDMVGFKEILIKS